MLIAGNIYRNPRPSPTSPSCEKAVYNNVAALKCDLCDWWLHGKCEGLSLLAYRCLASSPGTGFVAHASFLPPMTRTPHPYPPVSCPPPPLPPTKLPGPSPGTQNGVTLVTDVLLPHRGSGDTSASGIQTLYPSRTNSDLVVLFETSPNTIFGVSETWLDDTIFEGQIADTQKFSIFRKDRISSRGAGVALIVLSQFTCERRRNLKHIVAWMPASPQYQHTCVHSLHSAVNISYFYLIQIREKKKN